MPLALPPLGLLDSLTFVHASLTCSDFSRDIIASRWLQMLEGLAVGYGVREVEACIAG